MATLKAGAAKVDITPVEPCWMAGYGSRYENGPKSGGVHDPLHARVVVLEGEGGRAALVSCDLCFLDPETVGAVRGLAGGALGIPAERLMALATHTHAGPVSGAHDAKVDAEWLGGLAQKIAGALHVAASRLRPARLGVLRGESRVAMNRQQAFDDGMVELGAAPDKPTDPELIVLAADALDGSPIARIVQYNCHNTTLGPRNALLSADYAGAAMNATEATLGGGAVCLFLNGGAGNADPFHRVLDDTGDPRFREVCERFTADVSRTLRGAPAFGSDARVAGAFRDLALPRKVAGVEAGLGRLKRVRAQGLRIGDAVIVGSPNEVVCEIGMAIKRLSPAPNTLFVSYCANAVGAWHRGRDEVGGYIPAAAHYDSGGYEVRVSPYAPEAEAIYVREMVELAEELAGLP